MTDYILGWQVMLSTYCKLYHVMCISQNCHFRLECTHIYKNQVHFYCNSMYYL